MNILVNTSLGELVDKITILEIKHERIQDESKLTNIKNELAMLTAILDGLPLNTEELLRHKQSLKQINTALWDVEDGIRDKERQQEFDDVFIALARSVYVNNDQRAAVKKTINLEFGSEWIEEKSYQPY